MKRNQALGLFVATCLILAVLVLSEAITSPVAGIVFALALAVFGGLSRGFRGDMSGT